MATMAGFKFLQRNLSVSRVCRIRKIPLRISNYSRYATQLNFLRLNKNKHREYVLAKTNDSILYENIDEKDIEAPGARKIGEVNDEGESKRSDNSIDESLRSSYFFSKAEYNENNYIYRHVHKRLDEFAKMGDLVESLPIFGDLKSLDQLIKDETDLNKNKNQLIAGIISRIHSSIKYMNQQELAILLTSIKNDNRYPFRKIKRLVDMELRWLLKKHVNTRLMDIDLWFYLADIFYECLMRSRFVHVLVGYMSREEIELTRGQVLHLLFLVILQRDQKDVLSSYERKILQILNKASIEDLATICLAYFKTRTPIRSKDILERIVYRFVDFLPSLDPSQPGYCSIIKCLRYSKMLECRSKVLHFMLNLLDDPDSRILLSSTYNIVQTIKLAETYRIYDVKLLDILHNKLLHNMDEFRIKDIQYALTSLSNFAYNDLELSNEMKGELDSLCLGISSGLRSDSDKQYMHLLPLLRALSIFGYYNEPLLNYADQFLSNYENYRKSQKVVELDKSALLVLTAARLEGKIKFGARNLDFYKSISNSIDRFGNIGSVRNDTSLKHLNFILRDTKNDMFYKNSNSYRRLAKELSNHETLKNPNYRMTFQFTLPHQNYADLVISNNVPEPGSFDKDTLIPRRVPNGQKQVILLAVTRFDFIDGYDRLSGHKRLMKRLLTQLGYTVILADLDEANIDNLAMKIRSNL